ncbi:MAG: agmatine deiminase family protein [Bacteroidales bacterium]|nr:agmatine deiminase family protein [Bacteroidales bacterium]
MIDSKTNIVFFSSQLSVNYRSCKKDILEALKEHDIQVGTNIRATKDIWPRDYMPIQIDKNRFVRYKYNPDYLIKAGMSAYVTDKPNCPFLKDKDIVECDLVLDGGNIVVSGNKVILTEKVFTENSPLSQFEITNRIEKAFGKQVIWIPCDPHEIEYAKANDELPLCHADGILHAIDKETILLSNYIDYDPDFRANLLERLSPYFKIEEYSFGDKRSDNSWIYINYLQIGKVILLPTVGEPADNMALEKLKSLFHNDITIEKIDSKELTFDAEDGNVGGSLHCISWNVYDSLITK